MDGFVLVVGMIQVVEKNYINMAINAFGHKKLGGIGLATGQRFAEEGARVFVVDYNEKATAQVMKENPQFAG